MNSRTSILSVAILFSLAIASCKTTYKNPHVKIASQYGDIEIELYPAKAPKSVAAFLRYIDSGYYVNCFFYRILSIDNQITGSNASELVQGGLWANKNRPDTLPGIPHETTQQTGLHHTNGTISLAREAPGTATTEFFICIGDQPGFNYGGENNPDGQGYAAFGRVVKGMDIVLKIYSKPEENQFFDPPVKISKIVRL
ncbi:MAG: peptidylprolyl isomerase [Bacteroidota bacterium]